MWYKILTISCLLAAVCQVVTGTETLDFELKPAGIEQHVETHAYGVTCRFTYAAEGGTKEHWTLSLKRSKDRKDILCLIERPDVQSYLMFESFSVTLSNASVKSAKIYRTSEEKLSDDTLIVDHSTNTVSNSENFKNEMSKVRVRGTINMQHSDDEL